MSSTDYYIKDVDHIIEQAQDELPAYANKPKHLGDVGYKGDVAILKAPYDKVLAIAIPLLRHKIVDTRADAVTEAYDDLLFETTEGVWKRVGEVQLDREAGLARAHCVSMEKELARNK